MLLVVCGLGLGLLLLEAGLRLSGYRKAPQGGFHTSRWAKPDAELGWRYNPGVWRVDCENRPMTIQDDLTRRVEGGQPSPGGPTVLLVGCSYAAGYGVTDAQSMASQLQQHLGGGRVVNLATPGYGTYQAYLSIKRYLAEHPGKAPDVVLYGYAAHHPIRNVADWEWIASLKSYAGSQVVPPHLARSADGAWREVAAAEHDLFGLSGRSDLVFFIQSLLLKRRYGAQPEAERMQATFRSLSLMKELCDGSGARLLVANIFNNRADSSSLAAYCSVNGIDYRQPELDVPWLEPAYFLCGGTSSGHPNERYHAEMGRELAGMVRGSLAARP